MMRAGVEQIDRFRPARGSVHRVTFVNKMLAQPVGDHGFVVDDQNSNVFSFRFVHSVRTSSEFVFYQTTA